MMSSIIYSLVMLTLYGVNSFLQLMDFQKVRKNKHLDPNKSYRKFKHSVQDGGFIILCEEFIHIFNLLMC